MEINSGDLADDAGEFGDSATRGVRVHLRNATAARHQALDRALARYQVFDTIDRYTRLLMVHHRVRARLFVEHEGCAPTARWAEVTAAHHQALVDDLYHLGVPRATPERVPTGVAAPSSVKAAWGLLYVTEGSRLGGALLARSLAATLGPTVPSSFLSWDATALARWRRVCLDLERSADQEPAAAAASAAFDTYLEEFDVEFRSEAERTRG